MNENKTEREAKWDALEFLKGLRGHVRPEIVKLYECCKSTIINEDKEMDKNEVKKDLYKSKNMAKFSHYASGKLFYNIELSDGTYQFPIATIDETKKYVYVNHDDKDYDIITGVDLLDATEYDETSKLVIPILELSEDLGETSFDAEIKGSELIRWISKAIDNETIKKLAPKPEIGGLGAAR